MGSPVYPQTPPGGYIQLAVVTPHSLLDRIIDACNQSAIVTSYTVRSLDLDILNVRVYLVDDSFIEAFYNVTTNKTAFALIVNNQRIYGKDNAKLGWHVHPMDNPSAHNLCPPVSFEKFLIEVETLRFS